jgi:hypothetical protein
MHAPPVILDEVQYAPVLLPGVTALPFAEL